jgi:hypothetical protein
MKNSSIENLPDVMSACLAPARYVTSNFIKGRRLVFHNVGMYFEVEGTQVKGVGVEYPCLGQLTALVKANPKVSDFSWNVEKKKWEVCP